MPTTMTPAAPVEVEQPIVPDEIDPMASVAAQIGMKTSLILTQAQEDKLLNRVLKRIEELEAQMGANFNIGGGDTSGWMWERQKNQLQYDNEWEWRRALGGIFEHSNFSLNLSKRYARLMAAKTSDDLVGTDPFFSVMPSEHDDPEFAKQSEGYLQDEISESNSKRRIKGAQKKALIVNECVVKCSWVTNDTHFRGPGVVAVGPFEYNGPDGKKVFTPPGEPIMTPKGDYIYQKDDVFDDPDVEGLIRLEKEPEMSFRHAFEFAYLENLDQTLHGYTGLDIRALDFRDFLCPLNAATVHEADINVHLFDEQWERLVATYKGFEIADRYAAKPYMAGEKQPKLEKQEEETVSEILNIVNCADCYVRCNPYEGDLENDLGMESEIWIIVDRSAKRIIWYDYLANHMAKRPFEVIPGVELVENRWYGVGVFEMLSHKQLYVDTQFNRVNWKSMKSSSVRFRMKNAVEQWKAGEKMTFGDDKVYDIVDGRFDSNNPPFFEVNPAETDPFAMKLIELMIQAGSTEVGIVGPDDGAMAGLDTTKLATGIKSLERTGNLLMKFTEADHADAIAAILDQAVEIILEHMDTDELVFKRDTGALLALNRQEIRKARNTTKLLLTRSRSTEIIELSRMVIQTCREYDEALTPYQRYKLRPEYLRILRSLEVPNASELLTEVTKDQADQWLATEAKKPEPLPPKTSIATKFDDLQRPEQEQVLIREGIIPAPPKEVAKKEAKEVVLAGKVAEVEAKAKSTHAPPAKKAGA